MDRNNVIRPAIDVFLASLSARRAWIEISPAGCWRDARRSLSARRAWIEITYVEKVPADVYCRSPQGERG